MTYESTLFANRALPNTNGWQDRHDAAIRTVQTHPKDVPFQQPMVDMLKAWAGYAEDHKARYESKIGDDSVIGREWEAIGDALRGLLNGETGALDCGTVDGFILRTMRANGVNTDNK
jgi:hypothetical protein